MPVGRKEEEEVAENLTDKVAQNSTSSNASDHPMHTKEKATVEHHKANPGPVMLQSNIPEAASKEELKKRAEELNKK